MREAGGGGSPTTTTTTTMTTMDLLRSEPMQLAQLIIPIESAHTAVSYLGDLGLFQFKDVSPLLLPFLSFFFFFYRLFPSSRFECDCN